MLDVDEITRFLTENAGLNPANDCLAGKKYRQFYGLEFPGTHHEMGWLQVDGINVFVQHFGRRLNRHGTVFLLHGYLDHSGIQRPTIGRLLDLGFEVVTLDFPGHGLSTGDRATITSFEQYVDSLCAVHDFYHELPGPHMVMGHSLGGAISMTHLLKHPKVFEKAVLIAPLYRPKSWQIMRSMHAIGRGVVKSQPRVWRNNTRDADFRRFVREVDPLSPRSIPTDWVGAMFRWISEFRSMQTSDASVLVVQGTSDGTVDWRGNMTMIRAKFGDVRVHLVHQGRHQLLNETDEWRERVWEPITPFLSGHL